MFSTRFITAAAASLSLIASSTATYDASSRGNMAVYWGQGGVGPGGWTNPYPQLPLRNYCDDPAIDIIPVAFITLFPPQANGLVAENFADKCEGGNLYPGPGYDGVNNPNNNLLYELCPDVQEDIWYCQTSTDTKILLSLGGAVVAPNTPYQLNNAADGIYLANLLWGMYGPLDQDFNADWVSAGSYRPLDRGTSNDTASITVDIDGFDFDIEVLPADGQEGYIAAIGQLRTLYAAYKVKNPCAKDYLISGAPQCTDLLVTPYSTGLGPLGATNMGIMIYEAVFDILWIQFYNNDAYGCSARNAINGTIDNFNYQAWTNFIAQSASKNARLYFGLLASTYAGTADDYLYIYEAQELISAWIGTGNFGGVMLWDATYATNNIPTDIGVPLNLQGDNYYQVLNDFIKDYSPASYTPVTTPVQSKCSTTTSTAPTSSSTSSSTTTTSSSSTSTTSSSSSSTTSSSSSTSTTSSSSSSTTSSSSSTSTTSSSSSSAAATTTSTTSSTPTPTSVPWVVNTQGQNCTLNGCFTEGNGVRALSGATYVSDAYYLTMTVELCADLCSGQGFDLFGVEYGGECYCGNQLACGSVSAPITDCNIPCGGAPNEFCGAGNRLDVYQCGSVPASNGICSTSSSSTSTTSSSAPTTSSTSTTTTSSSSSSTTSSTSSTSATSSSSSSTTSSTSTTSSSSTSSTSSTTSSSSSTSSTTSSSSSTSSTVSSTSTTSPTTSSSSTSSTTSSSTSSTSSSSITSTTSSSSTSSASSTISSSPTSSTSSTTTSSSSASSSSATSNSSSSTSSSSPTTSGSSSASSSSSVGTSTSSSSSSSVSSSSTGSASPTSSTSTNSGTVTSSSSSSSSTTGPTSSSVVSGTVTSTSTSSSSTSYTTSTVITTSVYTVTSCAPTVTNCPVGHVTTDIITLYTTICPVTETQTSAPATSTPATSTTAYTTSTVYTTTVYTVTSCAPTVTNCPAKLGSVTTEVISLYTTVCPVTATETASASLSLSTTTISSTTTNYVTVKVIKSTATLVPYPSGSASSGSPFGTGSPSVSLVIQKATSTAQGAATSSPTKFTGAASSVRGMGVMIAVVVGAMALMI